MSIMAKLLLWSFGVTAVLTSNSSSEGELCDEQDPTCRQTQAVGNLMLQKGFRSGGSQVISSRAIPRTRPLSDSEKKHLQPLIMWAAGEALKLGPTMCKATPSNHCAPVPRLSSYCFGLSSTGRCTPPGTAECWKLQIERTFAVGSMIMNFIPAGSVLKLGVTALRTANREAIVIAAKALVRELAESFVDAAKADLAIWIAQTAVTNLAEDIKNKIVEEGCVLAAEAELHGNPEVDHDKVDEILLGFAKAVDPSGFIEVAEAFTKGNDDCAELVPVVSPDQVPGQPFVVPDDWEDKEAPPATHYYVQGPTGGLCSEIDAVEIADLAECRVAQAALVLPGYLPDGDSSSGVCYFCTKCMPSNMEYDSENGAGATRLCRTTDNHLGQPLYGFTKQAGSIADCLGGRQGLMDWIGNKADCQRVVAAMPWVAATTDMSRWAPAYGTCYYGKCYTANPFAYEMGICFDGDYGKYAHLICKHGRDIYN